MLKCSEQSFCGTAKKNYPNFKVRAAEEKKRPFQIDNSFTLQSKETGSN
jgi:hypothetical protein